MSTPEHSTSLATSAEVAAFLQVPIRTLDQWAYQGKGPQFSKVGRHRRYDWAKVQAYVAAAAIPTTAA